MESLHHMIDLSVAKLAKLAKLAEELQILYRRLIKMKKDFALEASATGEGHLVCKF